LNLAEAISRELAAIVELIGRPRACFEHSKAPSTFAGQRGSELSGTAARTRELDEKRPSRFVSRSSPMIA
jgi:hypothetical protein